MCTNRQMESVKVQHSTETPPTESCPSVSNKCQSANNICHHLLPLRHLASSASYLSMSPLSRAFLSRSFSYLRFHSSAVNSSFTITEFLIVLALYKAETKKSETLLEYVCEHLRNATRHHKSFYTRENYYQFNAMSKE